uniref:Uncharacterized protein n=1 Tax=Strongyloides papillosus TaxID=174720 RepID=A0A0N5B5K7_STREA
MAPTNKLTNNEAKKALLWTPDEVKLLLELYDKTDDNLTKTKRLEQICHHFPNRTIKAMLTKLRETKEEKGGKCEVKVKKNEEKFEGNFNFDNYEEVKMKKEVRRKKEEEPPIVNEINDEELLKVEKLFLKFVNTINYQRKKGKSTRMQKFNVSKDSFQ